jgi:hypothetical protein
MDWEGFEILRQDDSFSVSDNGFSVGVNFSDRSDIQLLSSDAKGDGEVIVGSKGIEVEGDFEPLEAGEIIDIFGVMIRAFEGEDLSYWFKMGSKSFYFSSRPGKNGDMDWLENNVDLAFLKVDDDSVQEAVKVKPRVVVPYGYESESDAKEFQAELEDRSFEVRII